MRGKDIAWGRGQGDLCQAWPSPKGSLYACYVIACLKATPAPMGDVAAYAYFSTYLTACYACSARLKTSTKSLCCAYLPSLPYHRRKGLPLQAVADWDLPCAGSSPAGSMGRTTTACYHTLPSEECRCVCLVHAFIVCCACDSVPAILTSCPIPYHACILQ